MLVNGVILSGITNYKNLIWVSANIKEMLFIWALNLILRFLSMAWSLLYSDDSIKKLWTFSFTLTKRLLHWSVFPIILQLLPQNLTTVSSQRASTRNIKPLIPELWQSFHVVQKMERATRIIWYGNSSWDISLDNILTLTQSLSKSLAQTDWQEHSVHVTIQRGLCTIHILQNISGQRGHHHLPCNRKMFSS